MATASPTRPDINVPVQSQPATPKRRQQPRRRFGHARSPFPLSVPSMRPYMLLNGHSKRHWDTVRLPFTPAVGKDNETMRLDFLSLEPSLTLPAMVIAVSATLMSAASAGSLCNVNGATTGTATNGQDFACGSAAVATSGNPASPAQAVGLFATATGDGTVAVGPAAAALAAVPMRSAISPALGRSMVWPSVPRLVPAALQLSMVARPTSTPRPSRTTMTRRSAPLPRRGLARPDRTMPRRSAHSRLPMPLTQPRWARSASRRAPMPSPSASGQD